MKDSRQGLIHIYCGDGKGKTTAAVGLAVRAAGRGKKVIFAQFMKGRETGEVNVLSQLENVMVIRNEREFGFYQQLTEAERQEMTELHNANLERIRRLVESGQCNMLILDEVTYPYAWGLIDKKQLEELIVNKPKYMELVMTGRNPAPFMQEQADYISEIQAVRHPYDKGIGAREGIEY